jgi:hypothetical protein
MEGGSLFNSGFLGASFSWWIGQIVDDSAWRDNIIPGKFENGNAIPGWGYRYKVRIIGLHDQGEVEIPSDQLPWAQVMFPITAGGGQTSATQTPNLRQGMMVFGFFLDEKDQQVPVIMGVLGNNEQTSLANTIGNNRVTNETPGSLATSGYAQGKNPPSGTALPKVPDSNLAINPSTGPTIEGINAVHLLSNSDIKRSELYNVKVHISDPNDLVGSAMKGIQFELENLLKKIDKAAHSVGAYVDAISAVTARSGCSNSIASSAEKIASYLKVIYYNVFSAIMKEINKLLTPAVDFLFPNDRFKFLDMKDIITEIINCLFKNLIGELISLVTSYLSSLINCDQVIPSPPETAPFVPMCTAENLVGDILASNKKTIQGELNKALEVVNSFLGDISAGLSLVGQSLNIASIGLDLVSLLNFENIILKFFGCDLLPNNAVSSYYTLQSGGGGITEKLLPNLPTVASVIDKAVNIPTSESIPFAQPTLPPGSKVNYSSSDSRTSVDIPVA